MEAILNDFEHQMKALVERHAGEKGFPLAEEYGFTNDEFDDYLSDKQVILDSEGEQKTRYTIAGVLIVAPVIVFSALPEESVPGGSNGVFVAVAAGLLLALLYRMLSKVVIAMRLKNMRNVDMERYIADVNRYDQEHAV